MVPALLLAAVLLAEPSPGRQLAPAPDAAAPAPAAETPAAREWSPCRVTLSWLVASDGVSRLADEQQRLLFNGEEIELDRELQVTAAPRAASVRIRLRLRAAMAMSPGVAYHLTTDAQVSSAVGVTLRDVEPQVRHAYLVITDETTQIHEAFVSGDLRARVLLGISARPVAETEPDYVLVPAAVPELLRFRAEAFVREGDSLRAIEQSDLTTTVGRVAELSFGSLAAATRVPEDPEHPLGGGLTVRDLDYVPDSGFGDRHEVALSGADSSWVEEHGTVAGDDFLREHEVVIDDEDGPRQVTIRQAKKNLSPKQRQRLRRQAEISEVQRMALERSKTLPGGEALPEGYRRESLSMTVRPLHASAGFVQAELRLVGNVKVPDQDGLVAVDAVFVEELERGAPFEVTLRDLVELPPGRTDWLFRVTALP